MRLQDDGFGLCSVGIPDGGADDVSHLVAVYSKFCLGDLNGNDIIDPGDLAVLLGAWGPRFGHPADFDGDGHVNAVDLATLLGNWGPCQP